MKNNMKLITEKYDDLIQIERSLLVRGIELMSMLNFEKVESELLKDALSQLDDLFLLVVAGEYNSGKSAFINALLGGEFLKTGITPTTDMINILDYGENSSEKSSKPGIRHISLPVPLLHETRIVDTPGTNAILREHEILTKEFIPRSDIVLFVTSIDRPFTESERAFLEQIQEWGKKIIMIINKVDLVDNPDDVATVIQFVDDNAFKLLDHHPQIFILSAKKALADVQAGIINDNLNLILDYVINTLNQRERMRIKLETPVNILEKLVGKYGTLNTQARENMKDDEQLIEDIHAQLSLFREDSFRRYKFRYADIDNAILEFQKRGIAFFDETFRLGRLLDLANNERMQREYKDQVIKGLSSEIDEKVNSLIEWLVDENYKQWQTVNQKISDRISKLKTRIVMDAELQAIQGERKKLIEDVRRESQRVIEKFDHNLQAKEIANDAQMSVAASAAIEAGAIGLGTLITILATTASADLTGLLLAGLTATLGFFIIPAKKKQAKNAFNDKIERLREQLSASLSIEISRQLDVVVENIQSTITPYDRFVKTELVRFANAANGISEIESSIASIRTDIEQI